MAIFAKVIIENKDKGARGEFIALLNSGSYLKPLTPCINKIQLLYIWVPKKPATQKLGADLHQYRKGKYVDTKNTYRICLLDQDNNPITCVDNCLLISEEELDTVIIPYELLKHMKIILDTEDDSWIHKTTNRKIKSIK